MKRKISTNSNHICLIWSSFQIEKILINNYIKKKKLLIIIKNQGAESFIETLTVPDTH